MKRTFIVVEINPPSAKKCWSKKDQCEYFGGSQDDFQYCSMFSDEIINKGNRCKKCIESQTEVDEDDFRESNYICGEYVKCGEESTQIKKNDFDSVHRCKLPYGHEGKHQCLYVSATGKKCNYSWKQ